MESRLTRGNIVIVPELICMAAWQHGSMARQGMSVGVPCELSKQKSVKELKLGQKLQYLNSSLT
ncbi:hypothetical protein N9B60_00790 [Mariniblastus sp.]|nr:hypothetical protein [Mariniblastus sp.]